MNIQVSKNDGKVYLPDKYLARDNDNLIQTFNVSFLDTFLEGVGQLDFRLPSGRKGYINMELENQKKHSFEDSIRGKFRESLEDTKADKNAKMRLGIIVGVILVGIYLFLNYV